MQIKVTGRGLDITPAIRDYAHEKVMKLEAFFNNIQKVEVVLETHSIDDAEKRQTAEIRAWMAGHKMIQAIEAGRDVYAALDLVIEEAKRQVEKHKDKLVHGKRRKASKMKKEMRAFSVKEEGVQEPELVKLSLFAKKPMNIEQAKDQLKSLDQDFLAFRNADNQAVNVVKKNSKDIEVLSASHDLNEDQALAELKKSGHDLIFFNNTATKIPSVIYRRKSGNFGLIEPEI